MKPFSFAMILGMSCLLVLVGCGVDDSEDEEEYFRPVGDRTVEVDENRQGKVGFVTDESYNFTCNLVEELGICAEYSAETQFHFDRLWAQCSRRSKGHSCPCGGAAICRHVNNSDRTIATSYAFPDTGLVEPTSTIRDECIRNQGDWIGTC